MKYMKYWIGLLVCWNIMMTATIIAIDVYYDDVTIGMAEHIVETHQEIGRLHNRHIEIFEEHHHD